MILGILFLILTGLSWIVIGLVISGAARRELNLGLTQFLAGLFIVLGSLALSGLHFGSFSWPILLGMAVAGGGNYFTYICIQRGMKSGPNGLVWSVVQSALIFPFLMGTIFFAVPCTIGKAGGCILILAGVILSGAAKPDTRQGTPSRRWLLWAVAAWLLAGATQCLVSLPSYFAAGQGTDVSLKVIALQAGSCAAFLASRLRRSAPWDDRRIIGFALVLALMTLLPQYYFFYRGLDIVTEHGAGSIGYPLTLGICIAGFALYSLVVLKERATLTAVGTIVLIILGSLCMI